ncbi:MAG: hypothetical protein WD011_03865, partial [Nitriliruptoraceae bacterium]
LATLAGVAFLALGATAATVTHRRLDPSASLGRVALAIAPHGVVIGGGAALVRGWDLVVAMIAGGLAVPLVAVVSTWWRQRRQAE